MENLVFLGTGGGRFATITQLRATGGFRLNLNAFKMHVDPGAGALVRAREFRQNPRNIDCVFVSHAHPDHGNDAGVVIEGMTNGMTKNRGYVIASKSVIDGYEEFDSCISTYHQKMPKQVHTVKAGDKLKIENVDFEITKMEHSDPTTVGFVLKSGGRRIGYISDTKYFPELGKPYNNMDILIVNVLRPGNARIKFHLCSDDAEKLLRETKPKLAIMQHFGLKMINENPLMQAQTIEENTGIRTIAATDGLNLGLDEADQTTLEEFKK